MSEIVQLANKSKSNNKIIILDCCFSGKMGEGIHWNQRSVLGEGVTIMTASNRDEYAVEDRNFHGISPNY